MSGVYVVTHKSLEAVLVATVLHPKSLFAMHDYIGFQVDTRVTTQVLDKLTQAGLACNVAAVDQKSSSRGSLSQEFYDIWFASVKFDHLGEFAGNLKSRAVVDETALNICIYRIESIGHSLTDEAVYGFARCVVGPEITEDQVEYGKRYLLRKLLSE